jgi:phosphoribosylanthranilate isomerase
LKRREDIDIVNEVKPEYIGFVFYKKSKRYVDFDTAKELKSLLDPSIQAVGVFVDESIDNVVDYLNAGAIEIAQLHGNEDEAYISEIKNRTGKEVIKAFKITDKDSVDKAFSTNADYVLLDAGMGDGVTFDWNLILDIDKPYFLAGGLGADNIANVMSNIRPFVVDVSSGIETDGIKDKAKMISFAKEVRKED